MQGKKILEELRLLLDDPSYSRYNEINQAYRAVCKKTRFNWLRDSSETLLSFSASTTSYTLNFDGIRVLTGIFVKGGNDARWRLMEESPPELFEVLVRENQDVNGTATTSKPRYYRIIGGQTATIEITPTPDQSYSVRVDYIKSTDEITENQDVNLPYNYFDTCAKLAASYVLRRQTDQHKQQMSVIYYQEAMREMEDLVRDSHHNRTNDISTKKRTWIQ